MVPYPSFVDMDRRYLLRTLGGAGTVIFSGCLGRLPPDDTGQNDREELEEELRFDTICADEVEREYISYEYLSIKNTAEKSRDISGYTVEYGSGHTYTVSELTLEPGATLSVLSRSGDDTVLVSYPPIYLRFAGLGEGKDTSVLEENGTVFLKNSEGDIVAQEKYENYGCQSRS